MSMSKKEYAHHQVFLAGVALAVLSLMALLFLIVSWIVGGDAFMATLYGKETMTALLIGMGAGISLALVYREKSAAANAAPLPLRGNRSAA